MTRQPAPARPGPRAAILCLIGFALIVGLNALRIPGGTVIGILIVTLVGIPLGLAHYGGVVSMPHGWGHGLDGSQLQVANDHPGVNSNLLNPAHLIDVPSGTQVVNGVPCRVRTRP